MSGRSFWVSVVFLGGLAAVFAGERVLGAGDARVVVTSLGVLAAVVGVLLRAARWSKATGDRRRVEGAFLQLSLLGLAALALYFVQSDVWLKVAAHPLDASSPKLATVLAVAWPALMTTCWLPTVFGEFSYAAMARAPAIEAGRVQDAILSGLGLSGALVFVFAAVYVGYARDVKWDLSYFRTTRPGAATRHIIEGLDEPVQVSLFFPPSNEVRDEVLEYFTDLAKENKLFQLEVYDQAIDVAKAKELGATGNGAIVVQRKTRKEQMTVGLDLESARGQLAKMDGDFQKKLLQTVKQKRTVYLVAGHGERAEERTGPTDQRSTIKAFRDVLQQQNYDIKPLTAADGLANEVPKDAAALAIIGPTSPFLPEELDALRKYLDRGGRILLTLDPESNVDVEGVLSRLGVRFNATKLANDQVYVRLNHQVSDHQVLATTGASSHPAVTSLAHLGHQAAFFLAGAGYLEDRKDRPTDVTVDYPIRAMPQTFDDLNNNFEFDPPAEQRKPYNLVAAITGKKPGLKPEQQLRAIVVSNSDCLTDLFMQNNPTLGNAYFALDAMKWLLGDESIAGEVSNEEDRPIEHTRKQDVFWFYSTIFLVPAVVLGIGWGVTRQRTKKGRGKEGPR
jgi:hypothetical protein